MTAATVAETEQRRNPSSCKRNWQPSPAGDMYMHESVIMCSRRRQQRRTKVLLERWNYAEAGEVAHMRRAGQRIHNPRLCLFFAIGSPCSIFLAPAQGYAESGHGVSVSCMHARTICTTEMLSRLVTIAAV